MCWNSALGTYSWEALTCCQKDEQMSYVILCNEEEKALGRSHQHLCWITSMTHPHHGIPQAWKWTSAPHVTMDDDFNMSLKSKPQKNLSIKIHFGKGQNRLLKIHGKWSKQLTYRSWLAATLRMTLEGKGVLEEWLLLFLKLFSFWTVCLCSFVYILFLNKIFLSGKRSWCRQWLVNLVNLNAWQI